MTQEEAQARINQDFLIPVVFEKLAANGVRARTEQDRQALMQLVIEEDAAAAAESVKSASAGLDPVLAAALGNTPGAAAKVAYANMAKHAAAQAVQAPTLVEAAAVLMS